MKVLFVRVFRQNDESQTFFYNPENQSRLEEGGDAQQMRAVNVASAPLELLSQEGSEMPDPSISFDDRDSQNRLFLKLCDGRRPARRRRLRFDR
ncbi:MAG: hypothetical protein WKF84_15150 [Pyrinomonadaceae bacterium]